jgi:hypothetical protein
MITVFTYDVPTLFKKTKNYIHDIFIALKHIYIKSVCCQRAIFVEEGNN